MSKRRQEPARDRREAEPGRAEYARERPRESLERGDRVLAERYEDPADAQAGIAKEAEQERPADVAIDGDQPGEADDMPHGPLVISRAVAVVLADAAARRTSAQERAARAAERIGTVQARITQLRQARIGDQGAVEPGAALAAANHAAGGYDRTAQVHDELARVHEIAAQLASELGHEEDARRHRERAALSRGGAEKARAEAARHRQPPHVTGSLVSGPRIN